MTDEKKNSDDEILRVARERFKIAEEAYAEIREAALDDLKFRAGDQWPDQIKEDRKKDNRPCLTINKLPQIIRQITNDQRQNKPSIKVFPVDDNGDKDTAKILQGMIKNIESNSNADVAYDDAFEGAVVKSFGYFRINTDYADPLSFNQELQIKKIQDHFKVYLDPSHKEPDGSDANWGFIFEDILEDDYKSQYKNSDLASAVDWRALGDEVPEWINNKSVRVAEYFYREFEEISIVETTDGQVGPKDSFPEGTAYVNERIAKIPVVKWCKINGYEILEKTDWPSQWIPIIPVYGDELFIEGKRILESITRHAKDPLRMYNYYVSTEAEVIALSPKAPYIAAIGQIPKELEPFWKSANKVSHPYLPYKAIPDAPPPTRNTYEAPVQAITNARLQSSDDVKATTGIFDATMGNRSNETSGIAIQRRNQQAQTSNFHFNDNLTRSLRHCGRILVEMIPRIYDTARVVRIIGEEDQQEVVKINEMFSHRGEQKFYNVGYGKYDVAVETGPTYATKRQETAAQLLELQKNLPPDQAAVLTDLILKSLDVNGSSEMAERVKKILPPGIIEDKEQKPIPPEAQAMMAQMDQTIQALTEQLNKQNEIVNTKRLEIESKEKIELMKIERDYKLEILKMQGAAADALMQKEFAEIERRIAVSEAQENQINNEIENGGMPDQPSPEQQPPTGGLPPGQFMGE